MGQEQGNAWCKCQFPCTMGTPPCAESDTLLCLLVLWSLLHGPRHCLLHTAPHPPGWRLLSLACVQVRLVILYALRFEGDSLRVRQMIDFLGTLGIRER